MGPVATLPIFRSNYEQTMTIDFERARRNMVDQQIRPWDVTDQRVLDAIAASPREDYVPAQYRTLAFVDMNIPLGHGQVMMQPNLEARLTQALAIEPDDKILEVGTGSGYVTSLLAKLGKHVTSVEIFPDFTTQAAQRLAAHGIHNVTLEVGDAARGWARSAPYDVIFITGSLPLPPDDFRAQLAPGGRLVAIVGSAPAMEARLIERLDGPNFRSRSLLETVLPPLVNAPMPAGFVF